REVEKELEHDDAVLEQILFKPVDLLEPAVPDLFILPFPGDLLLIENLRMYAGNEHFFIVGAIEDGNFAAFGQAQRASPEIIVAEFLGGRPLEGVDVA